MNYCNGSVLYKRPSAKFIAGVSSGDDIVLSGLLKTFSWLWNVFRIQEIKFKSDVVRAEAGLPSKKDLVLFAWTQNSYAPSMLDG